MQLRSFLLLFALPSWCVVAVHGQDGPVLAGYVTRVVSASDFDVNGIRILCREKAGEAPDPLRNRSLQTVECPNETPRAGESFAVHYTVRDNSKHAIYATRFEKQPTSSFGEISGSAVIDAAPMEEEAGTQPPGLTVRADGFRIRIEAKTSIEWSAPLKALADVKAGDWIKYKGKVNAAGVLIASSAQIGPNVISGREDKLRTKNEFDPSTVPADAKQNYLRNALAGGYDAKKFPPFQNASMQARIEKVGRSIVPAYQRALPDSDPAKIDFRFQLIDTTHFRETLTLPNGLILIPYQTVERLQNDSQLAAVLADGVAHALEKQQYRVDGKVKAGYAVMAATPFAPFAAYGGNVAMAIKKREMEQRGRVSLVLLHDGGYDIGQVPVAWWLLEPKRPQPLSDTEIPDRVVYLFRIMEKIWKNPEAFTPAVH
jgi:hypothetical protein